MRRLYYGSAECNGKQIRYSLTVAVMEGDIEFYGVAAEMEGEEAAAGDLTVSRCRAEAFLERLRRGTVPPSALRDVVEDWIEE